jgi:hypothetical protein
LSGVVDVVDVVVVTSRNLTSVDYSNNRSSMDLFEYVARVFVAELVR